jgi:pentatricopeptide repeat protein
VAEIQHEQQNSNPNPIPTPFDRSLEWYYNKRMEKTKRTARRDSNFIIYEAVSATGENYIGLTRKTQSTVLKSLKERWRKHLSRARNEDRAWRLYEYMRAEGLEVAWEHRVLAIVRGRAEAYALERTVVKEQRPTLNDQYC